MIGQDPQQVLRAEEKPEDVAKHPRRKCPHVWRGLSLFYQRDRSHLRRGDLKRARRVLLQSKATESVFVVKDGEPYDEVKVPNQEVVHAAWPLPMFGTTSSAATPFS